MRITYLSLVFLVCLALIPFPTNQAAAEQELAFRDVTPDHWAYETVAWSISHNITTGFEDHTFRPNEPVSEEQFMALLMRSFDMLPTDNTSSPSSWSDFYYKLALLHNYPTSIKPYQPNYTKIFD
jgi:hypothetical protein